MPSSYYKQMCASIVALLQLFEGKVPDANSYSRTLELAASENAWPRAHRARDNVRRMSLATEDELYCAQYVFEESCLETLYNETDPDDPFDAVCPYWVVPNALRLAQIADVPVQEVIDAMFPETW